MVKITKKELSQLEEDHLNSVVDDYVKQIKTTQDLSKWDDAELRTDTKFHMKNAMTLFQLSDPKDIVGYLDLRHSVKAGAQIHKLDMVKKHLYYAEQNNIPHGVRILYLMANTPASYWIDPLDP